MLNFKAYHRVRAVLLAIGLLLAGSVAHAQANTEYHIKAGFLYNFIAFTDWPSSVGSPLVLCVFGNDPFDGELNSLAGKTVNGRILEVRDVERVQDLKGCRAVFVSSSSIGSLPRILDLLQSEPVLTITDSKGALDAGASINMVLRQDRVAFEVNLAASRKARLNLSAKLLRLAVDVRQ